ncbi:MAG: YncE family protein [Bacteroidales bacterium]|nr:YncE family protein [Bacteroidales bacterium]
MKTFLKLFILLPVFAIFISCEKEPEAPDNSDDITLSGKGIYVLNEGLFNMNNSTLTWYDFETEQEVTDWFETQNDRKLGDTGNDLKIYGGKVYIMMSGSSQVEVLNASNGKSLMQIPFFDGEIPRQPRSVAFLHNKAFVCSFDGTVAVIDTTSLQIEKYISVGRNPDGITTSNNKIYVANSGGLDFPNYDNTVSVIHFDTMEETKKITVGSNPYTLETDENGNVYVISRGNYDDEGMFLHIIDSQSDELIHTFTDFQAMNFTLGKNLAYVYHIDWMSGGIASIMAIDLETRAVVSENFINDDTEIESIYGIYADKTTGEVFISDAKGFVSTGMVYCFDSNGNKKYSFPTGLNPGAMGVYYTQSEK